MTTPRPAGAQALLGLEVHDDLVLLHRRAQLAGQLEQAGAAVVEDRAVADDAGPRPLRLVHGQVGPAQHRGSVPAVRRHHGDADGDADLEEGAGDLERSGERGPRGAGGGQRLLR
jgi:hypothetical protein